MSSGINDGNPDILRDILLCMDDSCSHELSDARTVVLVLLHLNFEEIIDHIVGGSPPILVVTDSIFTTRTVPCKGAAGSLVFRFCINRIGPYVYMGQFIYLYICIHIILVYDMYTCIHIHVCVYMYTYHVGI